MGMGDVKLAFLLGVGLGGAVVTALVVGLVAACIVALAILVRGGSAARKRAIPFGPFLALGGLVALFFT
jgi:leader peptidase (prepilin peptidase) / N-methyltransferase